MDVTRYKPILWWSEDDQAYLAQNPELPGVIQDGPTPEMALKNAYDSAQRWMRTAAEKGWRIPQPQPVEIAA